MNFEIYIIHFIVMIKDLVTIGDYEQAEILLNILLKNGNINDSDNPLLLELVIRAGKVSGDDINELETRLKELITGKYSNINAIKELNYQLDDILIKCINECVGNTIYDGLKNLYPTN
eukprot:351873_1